MVPHSLQVVGGSLIVDRSMRRLVAALFLVVTGGKAESLGVKFDSIVAVDGLQFKYVSYFMEQIYRSKRLVD